MDSHEDATAYYELKMPKICHTQRLPPKTAAKIIIKPERLAHLCVEQDLLYPWMCYTTWFELHRRQDKRFSAPSLVIISPLLCQTVRDGSVIVLMKQTLQ